jgi:1-acyl-sn-glycerol-3-phosphate acyltransferase
MATVSTIEAGSEELSASQRLAKLAYLTIVGGSLLAVGSIVVLLYSIVSLFMFPEFCRQRIIRPFCTLILRIAGVRVMVDGAIIESRPCVYVSNHLSALDIFIVCSLGLPNTRYFMSVSTLKVIPMTIVGLATRVFYIAEQWEPIKRSKCFQRAERLLRQSGDNVYLTPEGRRNPNLAIQPFNKGAFHLAINLQRPIVALRIDLPPESNPRLGLAAKAGVARVSRICTFETAGLDVDSLLKLRDQVREAYLEGD